MSDKTGCRILGSFMCLWSFFSVRGEMWFVAGITLLCTAMILNRRS